MLIDAHVHVCVNQPDRYPWRPLLNYIPTAYAPAETLIDEMDRHAIDRAVLVQPSYYGYDNSYLAESLRRFPTRFAGVCLVDPGSDTVGTDLAHWMKAGCAGLRLNPVGDADGRWLTAPVWEAAGALEAVVCLQIRADQLALLDRLAARFQGVTIVVDHLGRADLSDLNGPLFRLARHPHVYVKVSGIAAIAKSPHPHPDAHAFVAKLLAEFGADRLLWGSDFPGHLTRGGYEAELEIMRQMEFFSNTDREHLCGRTARRLFWKTV